MPRGSLKIQKFHSLGQQKVSQINRTKKVVLLVVIVHHITNKVLVDKLHKSLKAPHQNPRGQFNSQSQEDARDQLRRVSLRSKQSHSSLGLGHLQDRGRGIKKGSSALYHNQLIPGIVRDL